jgi:ATP-dependent RNA helicase DOB1
MDIMAACDLYEGSIVRVIRRLNELVCELATAAKNIGNSELEGKLNDSGKRLKRGIIFAASLYV